MNSNLFIYFLPSFYVSTYLLTSYIRIYLLTQLSAKILVFLFICLPTFLPTKLFAFMYMSPCLPNYLERARMKSADLLFTK